MLKPDLLKELLPLGFPWAKKRKCGVCDSEAYFSRVGHSEHSIELHGRSYCSPKCLEQGLAEALERLLSLRSEVTGTRKYRLPLGLLMLSHGMIGRDELTSALEAQRAAGVGRIGEWLQRLGYVSELDITRALSIQWGIPMLAANTTSLVGERMIPAAILKEHGMLPVHYSSQQRKLYVACCDEIDRSMLYQIEQVLDCRIVPCVAAASVVRRELNSLVAPTENEMLFASEQGGVEMARICCSYTTQLQAVEVRVARCGGHIWFRLKRAKGAADLLFRFAGQSRTGNPQQL